MPITIQNTAGGGVTLDSTTTANETVNLPTGGGTLITTAGGTMTGVIAGFESTGIDDNATSTAITIDASENVGIGTASPSARFEVEDNGSATGGVIMKVTQDDQGSHYGMSVGNDAYSTVDTDGFVVYQMNNGHTYLYNGGVDEGPNIGMPVAGGITFGTDTAAANTLDDYEEGTWTPADGSGAGLTISNNNANYTKIGRIVHINAYVNVPSNSSGSQFVLSGLPFAVSGASSYFPTILNHNSSAPAGSIMRADSSSNNVVAFTQANTSVTNQNLSGGIVIFQLTYRTDS